MIFRTGSVLIVGHCTEEILNVTYKFIMNILEKFYDIHINVNYKKKEKKKKRKSKKQFICVKVTINLISIL